MRLTTIIATAQGPMLVAHASAQSNGSPEHVTAYGKSMS